VIPKNTEFFQTLFQAFTESPVVSCIIGGDAKQLVSDIIIAQDFQEHTRHVLAGMMVAEMIECQELFLKFEIGVNPLGGNR